MKKLIFIITLLLFIPKVNALDIHLFYSELCSTCEEEIEFLEEYKKEADINIIYYETTRNKENDELLSKVRQALNNNDKTVPYTVIGTTGITGFNETVKNQIKSAYEFYTYEFIDIVDVVQNDLDVDYEIIPPEGEYNIPILGNIDPKEVSLPLVSVIIGFIDGFNPCAMWVLLFLLSIIVTMKDRKKNVDYRFNIFNYICISLFSVYVSLVTNCYNFIRNCLGKIYNSINCFIRRSY